MLLLPYLSPPISHSIVYEQEIAHHRAKKPLTSNIETKGFWLLYAIYEAHVRYCALQHITTVGSRVWPYPMPKPKPVCNAIVYSSFLKEAPQGSLKPCYRATAAPEFLDHELAGLAGSTSDEDHNSPPFCSGACTPIGSSPRPAQFADPQEYPGR